MSWGFVAIFAFAVLAMIAIGVFSFLAKKRRREGSRWSRVDRGCRSRTSPFSTLGEPFVLFSPGCRGVENVLWGVWQGTDLRAFDDWYYRESRGAQGHTSRAYAFDRVRLCLAARCPHLDRPASHGRVDLPRSRVRVGGDRAFTVRSGDARFADDLMDARTIEWRMANATDRWIELVNDQILLARTRLASGGTPWVDVSRRGVRGPGSTGRVGAVPAGRIA